MKLILILFIFSCFSFSQGLDNTCNRIAYVNYQKILIDSSSTIKGDGLRYLLNKDPVSKSYLDIYQKNALPSWKTAIISTVGIAVGAFGLLNDSDSGLTNKYLLMGLGVGIVGTNFYVSKRRSLKNEKNLNRAIQEYNKRNFPKIYLSPEGNKSTRYKHWKFGFKFAKVF